MIDFNEWLEIENIKEDDNFTFATKTLEVSYTDALDNYHMMHIGQEIVLEQLKQKALHFASKIDVELERIKRQKEGEE